MKNVKLYIAITYGLAWAAGGALYLSKSLVAAYPGASTLWMSVCMFFPLIATLICQKSNKEPLLRGIGISWKINRWWFVGWLLVPVIVALTLLFDHYVSGTHLQDAVGMAIVGTGMGMSPWTITVISFVSAMVAGATINALFAFGEEVGWRGYLLKQFEGKQFLTSAIIIGLIWGLWHAPLILLGHNYPQHPQWGVLFMMVMSAILSIIIQYVRIKSGSVIVAAIMHGTLNALAGTGTLFVDNFNDLINGCCGVVGMTAMAIVAFCIFLFDRYVTRERICTSPLSLDTIKSEQHR